jgi:hypothetical protein
MRKLDAIAKRMRNKSRFNGIDSIRVVNYNESADYTRTRANHSTQHGPCMRFVETHDAAGVHIRTLARVMQQPSLIHKV